MRAMPAAALVGELRRVVGAAAVVDDPDVTASAARDWTGRFVGSTPALVRPRSVDEVAALLAWCSAEGVAVVPQGGNTGLVAGATPLGGEVVVSLGALREVGDVDAHAGQVTAGAGVTLAQLQRAVAGSPWAFGVDLAPRDSCTIGGMVATNAGGVRVVRHGPMRAQVLGVEAVLADGSVVRRLDGLLKDNTGYDLAGLLCGSEGTLAIVTSARLRLVPRPAARVTAACAVAGAAEAVEVATRVRRSVRGIEAIEFVAGPALRLVTERLAVPCPFAPLPAGVVVVEAAGPGDPTEDLAAALADLAARGDAVVALDPPSQARLWALRERVPEAVSTLGVPHKLDVTLPFGRLASFVDDIGPLVEQARPGAQVVLFGHLGDGNVHVNVLGVAPDDDAVDGLVFAEVVRLGGSISAEHGIGRAKARWLGLQRSAAELAAFRAIKSALDPAGILNPGVIVTDPA